VTTQHDTALRLIVLKVLAEELAKAKAPVTETLRETWTVGDRNAGKLPDGKVVGSVTFKNGATGASVTDRAAFEEWVSQVHPEEWETITPAPITRVRPAFEKRLTDVAKKEGEPVDPATGDTVPGITVRQGDPTPAVTLAKGAAELVAEAWRSGELSALVGDLLRPAIEAPTTP
jgi:hypothetical protein